MTLDERIIAEGLEDYGMQLQLVGPGPLDGETFRAVGKGGAKFWISDCRPGRYKQVIVPLEMQHPDFVE
jgi:hypothetical protein